MKFKIGDFVIIATVAVFGLILLFSFASRNTTARTAVVIANGTREEISLTGLLGETTFKEIKGDNDITLKLEMQNGKIRVCDSNCPNKTCMRMGWLLHEGMSTVCVPGKIIVEVKREDDAVDAITK